MWTLAGRAAWLSGRMPGRVPPPVASNLLLSAVSTVIAWRDSSCGVQERSARGMHTSLLFTVMFRRIASGVVYCRARSACPASERDNARHLCEAALAAQRVARDSTLFSRQLEYTGAHIPVCRPSDPRRHALRPLHAELGQGLDCAQAKSTATYARRTEQRQRLTQACLYAAGGVPALQCLKGVRGGGGYPKIPVCPPRCMRRERAAASPCIDAVCGITGAGNSAWVPSSDSSQRRCRHARLIAPMFQSTHTRSWSRSSAWTSTKIVLGEWKETGG